MRFRSNAARRTVAGAVLAGIVLVPLPRVMPSIAQSSTVIIQEDFVQREDLYAVGQRVLVEGVIEGDLVVATGELVITGTVEGDVLGVVWGRASIGGEVLGSVRVAAVEVTTDGTVVDDVVLLAASATVRGEVGRDLLHTVGWMRMRGTVARDVLGQAFEIDLEGTVRRDVDVAVRRLAVESGATIDGDLTYRSSSEARVSGAASVGGQFVRREGRPPLELRTVQRLLSFVAIFGLLFGGLVLAWAARRTTYRAAAVVRRRPIASLFAGIGFLVLVPVAAIPLLAVSLVGIPISLVLLALWLAVLFFGPIPAVTVVGARVLGGRGGLFGGLVAGVLLWRGAIWFIPFLGFFLYVAALVWGAGGWLIGAWEVRAEAGPPPEEPFARTRPPSAPAVHEPEGWEPPLPPLPAGTVDGAGYPWPEEDEGVAGADGGGDEEDGAGKAP